LQKGRVSRFDGVLAGAAEEPAQQNVRVLREAADFLKR